MNNRFVLDTRLLSKISSMKHYKEYAIPDKACPCFMQYHLAIASLLANAKSGRTVYKVTE